MKSGEGGRGVRRGKDRMLKELQRERERERGTEKQTNIHRETDKERQREIQRERASLAQIQRRGEWKEKGQYLPGVLVPAHWTNSSPVLVLGCRERSVGGDRAGGGGDERGGHTQSH